MTSKLLTFAAFVLAVSVLPARASTIVLTASGSQTPGSSFDVTVELTDVFGSHPGDALAAFGFDVVIGDTSVVSFTGETIGPLFDDVSGLFGPSPQVAGFATAGFLTASDFTDPLILATLHFNALTGGSSSIGINTDLSDPNQGLLYLTAGADPLDASTRASISAVPEPSTAVFGGLTLASLLLYRRLRAS
jgi:hypothetical protein